jgi:hypothetical protein
LIGTTLQKSSQSVDRQTAHSGRLSAAFVLANAQLSPPHLRFPLIRGGLAR